MQSLPFVGQNRLSLSKTISQILHNGIILLTFEELEHVQETAMAT